MRDLHDRLQAWLQSLAPTGLTVIRQNQNAPTPPLPFLAWRVESFTDIARDRAANVRDIDDTGEGEFPAQHPPETDFVQDVVRFATCTLEMQIHAAPDDPLAAEELAQDVLDAAYDHDSATDNLGRSVAFQMVLQAPQNIDGIIGAEFEPRVVMSWQMGVTRDLLYRPGAIERAIIDGQIDSQTTRSDTG